MRLALLIAALLVPSTAQGPVAERLMSRSLDSLGGEKALRELRNVYFEMEIVEQGRKLIGHYRATRAGLMRIDVLVGGKRVYSEGIDSAGSWEQAGDGAPVVQTGRDAREALEHGITYLFNGIWLTDENGTQVEPLGSELVDGTAYQVVRLSFPDGFDTRLYINPQHWRVERQRDERAFHPSQDPKKAHVEKQFLDFRPMCGVNMPFRQRNRDFREGRLLGHSQIIRAECNLPPEALELGRPASLAITGTAVEN